MDENIITVPPVSRAVNTIFPIDFSEYTFLISIMGDFSHLCTLEVLFN